MEFLNNINFMFMNQNFNIGFARIINCMIEGYILTNN